ncbi:hypothetical protein [Tenacibaculum sp. MAR_2009_124]|uniref:hypothetical protein n=1 Tax=Tenacibaculum sp. MAR_2009_124 TaxID=1250059 RepID=UPI000B8163A6|nr:hypothetical protein [Tenacibaculum sp. MAR_2009_124]
MNTRAGDFSTWKIAWDQKSDSIIMYSGDVGSLAFVIKENRLCSLKEISTRLFNKAEKLRGIGN